MKKSTKNNLMKLCTLLLTLSILFGVLSGCRKQDESKKENNGIETMSNNSEKEATLAELESTGEILYDAFTSRGGFRENSNDLFPFYYKETYGYADVNGNVVIESKYNDCTFFSEDKAFVETIDGKVQIINKTGDVLYTFDDSLKKDYDNNSIMAELKGKSFKNSTLVLSFPNISTGEIKVYVVSDNKGEIDVTKHVIPNINFNWNVSISPVYADGFVGIAVKNPFIHVGKDLCETTIVDFSGNVFLQYSSKDMMQTEDTAFKNFKSAPAIYIDGSYINAINDNGMWGIVDINTKEIIIDFEYDYIGKYNEECIAVCSYGKWGAIDSEGKTVVPFEYDYIGNFNNNRAFAVKNGVECYIINMDGQIEYKYNNSAFLTGKYGNYLPSEFSDKTGIALVENEGEYFVITNTGKILLQDDRRPYISEKYVFSIQRESMYQIVMQSISE